jgi:hypothetical protein
MCKEIGTDLMTVQKVYLQLRPNWSKWRTVKVGPNKGLPELEDLTPVAVSKSRPAEAREGCIVIELELDIDDAAFYPLRPAATVVVPVQTPAPVTVTASPISPTVKPKPPKAYQQA